MRRRNKNWSYRQELNNRTASAMIANKYSWNDVSAIRMLSNNIMDMLEKEGVVTRAESDRLSQDITIKEVQKILKEKKLRS